MLRINFIWYINKQPMKTEGNIETYRATHKHAHTHTHTTHTHTHIHTHNHTQINHELSLKKIRK